MKIAKNLHSTNKIFLKHSPLYIIFRGLDALFSGGWLRPPSPRSRVRPGAILRWRVMSGGCGDVGLFFGGIFASSFLFFEE